jgi:hypothetical protein
MQLRSRAFHLYKIKKVPVQVLEHSDGAIAFKSWFSKKRHAPRQHQRVITLEIVCLKKHGHTSAGLTSDDPLLRFVLCLSEQDIRARCTRRNHQPALAAAKIAVFDQREAKLLKIKRLRLVIVTHHNGDEAKLQAHLLRNHCKARHNLTGGHVENMDLARAAFQRHIQGQPVSRQTLTVHVGTSGQDDFTRTGYHAGRRR